MLDRLEQERRHALHRDLDDDAERTEPEAGGGQQSGVVLVVDTEQLAVGGDERQADDLRRQAAEARARCRGCPSIVAPAIV